MPQNLNGIQKVGGSTPPGSTKTRIRPPTRYGWVLALAALAFVVSPAGIRFVTGREDLGFRVTVIGICLAVFLLTVAGALAAPPRGRRSFFYLICWTFPFALLALAEAAAISVHLADRIAPLEDTSVLAHAGRWPPHLMSNARMSRRDGLTLYQPWQGDGINELGLRTASPTPKAPGEWRVAVTGGSTVWGWRVFDRDTIPVLLERLMRDRDHRDVTVYNFGIEAASIVDELALLRRFRDVYGIDQAVLYTGANDVTDAYLIAASQGKAAHPWLSSFELVRVASRLRALWSAPPPPESSPPTSDRLRDGVTGAREYCRSVGIRCDFVLQPFLLTRRQAFGPEVALRRAIERTFPGMDQMIALMYGGALAIDPTVHDFRDVLDGTDEPMFADIAHVNEAANRVIARRIAESLEFGH